jgi:hypothetical protein
MKTTAQRLASLWTSARAQLGDGRDAHAAQATFERQRAGSTPEVLIDLSTALCHRI